jgi:hypothetical protein
MLAASLVETYPETTRLDSSTASFPLTESNLPIEAYDFITFRGPIRPTSLLDPILVDLTRASGLYRFYFRTSVELAISTRPRGTASTAP